MKKVLLSLSIAIFGFTTIAQNKEKNILTIDNKEVLLEDFIYVYEKNNGKQTDLYTQKSLDESLNLYINYRLKVTEAEFRKLDTTKAFIQELEGYRKQLAKPYMTDDSFLATMTKEAYDRIKEDVNTSHILFMCDEFASPEDTLKAYTKALDVRKKILSGQDFGQLAIQYSEDPSAKEPSYPKGYKGYLGYNLAFTFVYPYESAAYKTAVGQISMPVRTKFGYHIIKVNEKRVNPGEVRTAHIMIDAKDGIEAVDSIAQRQLAFDIYKSLKEGGDWNELCSKFSSDARSAEKGGELQAFQLDGKLRVPVYEQAAFALKNVGDFSEPVKSPYGWHIIKLLEKTPVASFEVLKDDLTKKVKSSDRFALNEEVLMRKLKDENKFKETKGVKAKLSVYADSTLNNGTWTTPIKAKRTKKLFTLNKEKVTYGQFYTYLEVNQKNHKQAKSPSLIMSMAYDKFVNQTVYNYAESNLGDKHPEYKMLLKEFRDGILFFELMQKEVWNKASADTTGIKNYYESNKTKYVKPLEYNATVYKAKDLMILNQLIDSVKAGKSETQIKMHFTKESALNLTTETKIFEKGKNEWIDKLSSGQKDLKIVEDGNFIYIKVYEEIPEGIKPLAKCRGLVIADYQSVVEKEWVDQLKAKYKVSINQELVKSLVK